MPERTGTDTARTTERPLGDLGRRLAARRAQLGLTRQETAARAGMASTYLKHLEEHPGAAPNKGTMLSLAAALETTVSELTGGVDDLPPGPQQAAPSPQFTELGLCECMALLGTHGVGRIAVSTASGPVIVPVNYTVVHSAIVFRTASGATPSLVSDHQVAFEVDRIDEAFSRGWSVLVRGPARTVTDHDETRWLDQRAYSAPWAGGHRDLWVCVEPHTVTGRRITV
ncbi:MAG: helix-turn-helix domain-containing protein [Streptomyces sp.]|nr:helix-turn-helix domain-containing protein [Streptomyces sp.]NUS24568.1 helix-turn-helix domain-containing protein [Streptomyces sp.]